MRIRHKELRALHEWDNPVQVPRDRHHDSSASLSSCKRRCFREVPIRRDSDCIEG